MLNAMRFWLAAALLPFTLAAADWAQFRGPNGVRRVRFLDFAHLQLCVRLRERSAGPQPRRDSESQRAGSACGGSQAT
jgi:hypothetical protein